MGNQRMGPPEELVLALQRRLGLQEFVETGTFRGETAAWAGRHFARVATIELSPEYHAAALRRFAAPSRVEPLQGDSVTVLARLLPTLQRPIFWLDAHWSGLDTAGRENECPLLDELGLLNASALPHVVLVDDARLFCAPPPRPHRAERWPDLATTVAALSSGGRRHVTLFDDVFVAVPASEREFLDGWLQDTTTAAWQQKGGTSWWRKFRR